MAGNVRLKPGDHRVLTGTPWVFRGEIAGAEDAAPGGVVTVLDHRGRFVGRGFYNPESVIAVRIVSWRSAEDVTGRLLAERLEQALRWRRRVVGEREAYRVVHSEADGIPGLIVDKYAGMLVVEVLSRGLVRFVPELVSALVDLLNPRGIFERGDTSARAREGLPRENRVLYGDMGSPVVIREHGVKMAIHLDTGQKTGHFLDQYVNRGRVGQLAAGLKVFDAFCHTGGFALVAAINGATDVVGIDIDREAVDQAEANARRNALSERVRFVAENAFDWLRRESDNGAQYDLGILDPPAFTRSKDALAGAIRGYKEINLRGIKLMRPGGLLMTSSCSYHLSEPQFLQVIQTAAHDARRHVRIVEIRGQGPDHPVLPALPESRYLKCLLLSVD
ncbi:MAG: class I SAM-dependent rRNA methyltransferase [Thermaerobacter sp.]|nr:class I SAM-dependent rRNA methyltransferase [Thermaerobacter sp.]